MSYTETDKSRRRARKGDTHERWREFIHDDESTLGTDIVAIGTTYPGWSACQLIDYQIDPVVTEEGDRKFKGTFHYSTNPADSQDDADEEIYEYDIAAVSVGPVLTDKDGNEIPNGAQRFEPRGVLRIIKRQVSFDASVVFGLTGMTNNAAFEGNPAGTMLFMGGSARRVSSTGAGARWQVTYTWQYDPLAWVHVIETAGAGVQTYRLYDQGNFAALGVGS